MGGYVIYMVIGGVMSLIGMIVSKRLKSKFAKYAQMPTSSGLTGKEIAEKMLDYYGVHDVEVVAAKGFLTDHYNPLSKTVALSEAVYNERNVSAAAVAAHECGHAIQHANAYPFLKLRSGIVPVVKIASGLQQVLLYMTLGGFAAAGTSVGNTLLLVTVIAFGVTLAFSLITLPVEFDASRRALVWLDDSNVTHGAEYEGAKDALQAAAMTYVAAALSALAMFAFFLMRFMAASRD